MNEGYDYIKQDDWPLVAISQDDYEPIIDGWEDRIEGAGGATDGKVKKRGVRHMFKKKIIASAVAGALYDWNSTETI